MQQNNLKSLFWSMLKAIFVGIILATVAIFIYKFFTTPNTTMSSQKIVSEEDEEDPTFISRFSRAVISEPDNSKEIIEQAKNSLPQTTNKKISAGSYVVINLDTDMIVLEKDADKLQPLASVTKLVTAVVARKLIDQSKYVTIDEKILGIYGSEGKLRFGEKLRVSELMYPMLMVSSNDSAEAIAQSYTYGRNKFIKEMNLFVNSIGAYRTYFKDASGLSSQNVSTAQDLSIIIKWILKNDPGIFDITLLKSMTIRTHTWTNPTHFLNLTSYIGGKNGYTPEANRTSVSLFKIGKYKRTYGVVLLGSSQRDNDTLDLLDEALR
jgi:D-alanyl-D-alanine carboxypeptidase